VHACVGAVLTEWCVVLCSCKRACRRSTVYFSR
jgi:hypothetical protein